MSDDDEEEVLLVDGGSVKRPRCNKQERWDQLVSSGWVRTTESDRAVWFGKVDRGVWCIPCKQFWANAEVRSWFRDDSQLCALGRWYAEMPLSNVATERVFSLMRASEGPLRHNMAEHSMDEELGAKVNAWIVDAMVERQDRLFK